jgi:hypothetical protein
MDLLRGMVWLSLLPVTAGCQSQRMTRQHLSFDMAVADLYKKHVLHNLAMRDQGDVIVQMTHNAFAGSLPGTGGQRPELGLSYPGMSRWRYEALAKFGRADVALGELRRIWARQPSVVHNNTLGEDWDQKPDGAGQWSHNTVVPLVAIYRWFAGITPMEPGYRRVRVHPQLVDLDELDLTAHTPLGPIEFAARKHADGHEVTVSLPPGCNGQIETGTMDAPTVSQVTGGRTTCFQVPLRAPIGNAC